ncbi:hypothetical protein GVAV_003301 [Gurleya vavrai]
MQPFNFNIFTTTSITSPVHYNMAIPHKNHRTAEPKTQKFYKQQKDITPDSMIQKDMHDNKGSTYEQEYPDSMIQKDMHDNIGSTYEQEYPDSMIQNDMHDKEADTLYYNETFSKNSKNLYEKQKRNFENDYLYSSNLNDDKTHKFFMIRKENSSSNINSMTQVLRFSGKTNENIDDWLRQFNYLFTYGETDIMDEKIHHFASSFLIGKAGKYYDELKPQPKNWLEFINALIGRYQVKKVDKSSVFLEILTKKQQRKEKTKDFIRDIAKLSDEVKMNEEMAVQATIENLLSNQTLYRLHLKNNYTFKALIELVDIIEVDNDHKCNIKPTRETIREIQEQQHDMSDLMNRIDKLTLSISQPNRETNLKASIYCQICKKNGHSKYDCSYNSTNTHEHRRRFYDNKSDNRNSYHNNNGFKTFQTHQLKIFRDQTKIVRNSLHLQEKLI